MSPKLDFDNQNTLYATHGLHAFAAKCPPPLVRYALRYYSKPNELVLDPMAGSGTALVEAHLMGRRAVGYEIDPLARLIAQVKSRPVPAAELETAQNEIVNRLRADLTDLQTGAPSAPLQARANPPDFLNRDHWFLPAVAASLSLLAYHLAEAPMSGAARDFFWVAFSSLILARTSVASARDVIHSRPHYQAHLSTPDVLARFEQRGRQMRKQMAAFQNQCQTRRQNASPEARLGDARQLQLPGDSVDLIFSSPPYATALDYPRAHFLAIPWMQAVLGIDLAAYRANAPNYVGSQQGRLSGNLTVDERLAGRTLTNGLIQQLAEKSPRQAKLCQRYFVDMQAVLGEMARVLKPGRHAVIVVCPSHIRQVPVPTHRVFVELGREHGLRLKQQTTRTISERRRVMPYMSQFGKRMSTEYVLILQKE